MILSRTFTSECGINPDEVGHSDGGSAADHGPDKEVLVTDRLLNPSGCHAGEHHAESHETGADTVMSRAVTSFREIDEIEHVGCEAETVAELFDKHTDVYYWQ